MCALPSSPAGEGCTRIWLIRP